MTGFIHVITLLGLQIKVFYNNTCVMLLVVSDSCLLPNPVSGTSEAGQGSESEDKAEGCREGNTSLRGTVLPVPNQVQDGDSDRWQTGA